MTEEIKVPNCRTCGVQLIKHKEHDYYCCPNWKPDNMGCPGDILYLDGAYKKNYPAPIIFYKVESRSEKGHFYTVKIYESGDIECQCVADQMARFCYHQRKTVDDIEILIRKIKKANYPKNIDNKTGTGNIANDFNIRTPYFGAWTKYGWEKGDWGIGLNKERIDLLALRDMPARVTYGKDARTYMIPAKEVQKYPVEGIKESDTEVYIVPKSALNIKTTEEEEAKELSRLSL